MSTRLNDAVANWNAEGQPTPSEAGINPGDVISNWEDFGEHVFDYNFPDFAGDSSLKDLISSAVDLHKQMDEREKELAAQGMRLEALSLAIGKRMNVSLR